MKAEQKRKGAIALVAVLAIFISLTAGCSQKTTTSQDTISLRLGHVVQPSHPMHLAVDRFANLVNERSNGDIKITIYPARQLGDDRQLFEQVQQGSLDMAEISAAPMGSTTPLVTALQLPFLFNNWDQYLKTIKSPAGDNLLKGLEKNGVKGLAVYNAGFRHFVSVNKPVKSPEDLWGLKFRVGEAPLHVDIFKDLGASPTPMPYGEIYSSLQNNVIDGLEMDLSAILMEKHYEVAKNVTLSGHFTWPAVLMMNLDKYNSLPPDVQKIIQQAAQDAVDGNIKDIRAIEEKAVKELKSKGVNIIELPALAPFIEKTRGVHSKYAALDPAIDEFAKTAQRFK